MDTITTIVDSLPDSIMEEGPIQMLNIDTLLVIFNFLSLYDKLMAMRVNKKWHQVIRNHHAWTVIDLTEKGPCKNVEESRKKYRWFVAKTGAQTFEHREYGNEWTFPKTVEVLRFINIYADLSLRELNVHANIYEGGDNIDIYIDDSTFDSEAIIKYLLINCPNVQVLTLALTTACKELPKNLVSLKLNYLSYMIGPIKTSSNQIISCVSKCQHLQNLTLNMELFHDGMKMLSQMTHLNNFELHRPINNGIYTNANFSADFESTIGKMVCLQHFRLSNVGYMYVASSDPIFQSIARWTNLKSLTLVNFRYTSKAFEIMVSQLLNLEKLSLAGEYVTSSVVQMIGTHLKKLKLLQLPKDCNSLETSEFCETMVSQLLNLEKLRLTGSYVTSSVVQMIGTHLRKLKSLELPYGIYTAESLQSLSHHPMLEHLVVREYPALAIAKSNFQLKRHNWVVDVYKVLVTLSRIRTVQLLFNDFDFTFPEINYVIDSADIEFVRLNGLKIFSQVGPTIQGKVYQ